MTDTELKPCPFCGGEVKLFNRENSNIYGFACEGEKSCLGTRLYTVTEQGDLDTAIAQWNITP